MKYKQIKIIMTVIVSVTLLLGGCSSAGGESSTEAPYDGGVVDDAADDYYEDDADDYANDDYGEDDDAPVIYEDDDVSVEGVIDSTYREAEDEPLYEYDEDSEYYTSNRESYLSIAENREILTAKESMSTFSLKVDTASYNNVERYIDSGRTPPANAVKTEELINYFNYEEELPFSNDCPFSIYTETGPSPLQDGKYTAFVRVKSKEIDKKELPSSNLTFLIDTSGSMDSYDKLPLLQEAFSLLAETLDEDDHVSIVTYAGSSEVLLDSENGANKKAIMKAIDKLSAGGSTAGADGIMTAYALAEKNYRKDRNNRIILATDGDFNVGISDLDELETLISQKRDSGIYLSILGFGTENLKDDTMETLSANGNGNYSYINSVSTAQKVLVEELASNLYTAADDVKAQIEFNPQNVKSYRLIGYENRSLRNEDFDDDSVDAGEIGVGTDVVVMFELELYHGNSTDSSGYKYSGTNEGDNNPDDSEYSDELFEVRIRYKDPGKSKSKLIKKAAGWENIPKSNSSDYNFACSVAAFGHLLRGSSYAEDVTAKKIRELAKNSLGKDEGGYRKKFLDTLRGYEKLYR